jgi:hypothetical protein
MAKPDSKHYEDHESCLDCKVAKLIQFNCQIDAQKDEIVCEPFERFFKTCKFDSKMIEIDMEKL